MSTAPELLDLPPDITHFYRYSTTAHLDWLKPVILEHKIYIPTAKQLNDPRECKPPFLELDKRDIARFLLRSHCDRNAGLTLEDRAKAWGEITWMLSVTDPRDTLRQMADILYERTEKTRVFSMSKRWNNPAMWAKYADNHQGYCLEFARVGVFELARPVLYDNSKKLDLRDRAAVDFGWTHYKSPDWSNEEEIRVVLPTFIVDPWCPIGPEGLTRILLGMDMRPPDRQQVLKWAKLRTPALTVMDVNFDRYTHDLTLVDALGP